jgi:two-component system, chemotaxis family, chemotaxis protein CheY
MNDIEDELLGDFAADCRLRLEKAGADLCALESGGAETEEKLANRLVLAVRSVRAGAALFDLVKVGELAGRAQEVLDLIRAREMVPTPARVTVLLSATDRLLDLLNAPAASNNADIADVMASLAALLPPRGPAPNPGNGASRHTSPEGRPLRMLLVEDDFASRLLLQTFLSRYGECQVAVTGREAVDAFRASMASGQKYDLICMDIMMPEMDGREATRQIRAMEASGGVFSASGAKIVMSTAVSDLREVSRCFNELCDGYLVKPIDLSKLLSQMKSYNLVR